MKFFYYFILFVTLIFNGCSTVRESAGVTRKSIDETQVIENPPLVIPPDFNILPPDQLKDKNIDDIEKELAKEILFGLDNNATVSEIKLSTINQILLKTKALDIPPSIRDEIDKDFSQELKTDGIFQVQWENEIDVLDAIKESKRIRDKNFEGESIADGEVPIKKDIIKKKKKKRFIFF